MSRTLFLYIFRDLLRVFLLSSGALAGIMSFGGLLRPLTEHGLNAAQAAKMLSYFMPAMMTYSLPIAALFATTMVYGRLAADNELVACRAAGISFWSISIPALVLGLTVALISLLFLCFIVPLFTLKVEQVIYSNLAQLIANDIERTHQVKFDSTGTTIFAQEAAVADPDPKHPENQIVSLGGVMIIGYDKIDSVIPDTPKLQVPHEFYLAKQATVFIHRDKQDNYTLEARLEPPGGAMFPRHFTGQGSQGGVQETQFGPMAMDSPIHEDTKFMDIRKLHELAVDVGKSKKVQLEVQRVTRLVQEARFLDDIRAALAESGSKYHFNAGPEQYDLIAPRGGAVMHGDTVRRLLITPARLVQSDDKGNVVFTWDSADIELSAHPVNEDQFSMQATLHNVSQESSEGSTAKSSFTRNFTITMPQDIQGIAQHDVNYYRRDPAVSPLDKMALQRQLFRVSNSIQGEMHSRASFAISCLILVIVGCALGMMFKSGNFLTAFAISVVPALVTIALIVAGQHTCENIPWKIDAHFQNPLGLGLVLIWTGNAIVLTIATVLCAKLSRQ